MRRLNFLILAVLVVRLANFASPAEASSPSFACKPGGSVIEQVICSDAKLAAEDRLMTQLFGLARVSAFGSGPSNELNVQRQWLKSRESCAASPGEGKVDLLWTKDCLSGSYAERNERLSLAVLFSRPEISLPVIRRLDPDGAPMFETIYLYARSRRLAGADRLRVIALLQRYKDTPGGWGDPSDAVKSDTAFAEFVGVRSAGLPEGRYDRVFPCAAAVRKPKLLEATGPHFGSNMDNFVIQSDCEDTLPPLPKFSALVEKRKSGMTDCGGGSIRFAYYRSFWNDTFAARLATSAQLRHRRDKPFPRRRGVSSADVEAALAELAAYYVRYGRTSAGRAPPLARQMIYDMLDEAWQC